MRSRFYHAIKIDKMHKIQIGAAHGTSLVRYTYYQEMKFFVNGFRDETDVGPSHRAGGVARNNNS